MGDLLTCLLRMRHPHLRAGSVGHWTLSRFTVTPEAAAASRLRAMCNPQRAFRFMPAGRYWCLDCDGATVMTDTPDERRDHYPVVYQAAARVVAGERVTALVFGLGLGMVTKALLDLARVDHVTVVEIDPDVRALIGAAMQRRYRDRLTLIGADAFTWQPPKDTRWTVGWADIWNTIGGKHWPAMKALRRRYGRRCQWWGAWCERLMRREARRRHVRDQRFNRLVFQLAGARLCALVGAREPIST